MGLLQPWAGNGGAGQALPTLSRGDTGLTEELTSKIRGTQEARGWGQLRTVPWGMRPCRLVPILSLRGAGPARSAPTAPALANAQGLVVRERTRPGAPRPGSTRVLSLASDNNAPRAPGPAAPGCALPRGLSASRHFARPAPRSRLGAGPCCPSGPTPKPALHPAAAFWWPSPRPAVSAHRRTERTGHGPVPGASPWPQTSPRVRWSQKPSGNLNVEQLANRTAASRLLLSGSRLPREDKRE